MGSKLIKLWRILDKSNYFHCPSFYGIKEQSYWMMLNPGYREGKDRLSVQDGVAAVLF